ncbi:MAG: DUF86 domain-containing protein [Planctomycetes bacterium]|nr:DUF86 domain-containing protein [Planctomycetota bacterium]
MINFEIPQKDKLIKFLKSDSRIMLVYIFGSQVKGHVGKMSDYDIAIFLLETASDTYKYELQSKIARILDAPVDLVILNVAPAELKYAVIASGLLIYEKDKATRVEFEGDTLSRYFDFLPVLRKQQAEILKGARSEVGIHRYRESASGGLERLKKCLQKLEPLVAKSKEELIQDEYLKDIIERNLEIAIQACIDICNRIISVEELEKPKDYFEAIIRLGENNILPYEFAQKISPIAGFRNILIHEYIDINWDEVYKNLQNIEDFYRFMSYINQWLASKSSP